MPAAKPFAHQACSSACLKKERRALRGGGNRDSAPALDGLQAQKGVELLKRDLLE